MFANIYREQKVKLYLQKIVDSSMYMFLVNLLMVLLSCFNKETLET
jgi:hypothetical protein